MSSPFAPKLWTNYCPSDEEVAEIRTLLVDPALQLKRLSIKINAMQQVIDQLAEERDRLSAYIDAHKALISPFRRLPIDIVQEIFMACLPTHRNCVMSAREAPVLLGRICSSWRAISLATPRLWARLHIVEPTRPYGSSPAFEEKLKQRLETTKAWLGRSGQCPLSLSLESGQDHHDIPTEDPVPIALYTSLFIQALIPFASRWQHISFTIPPPILDSLQPLTEEDVPALTSVALYQRPEYGASGQGWGLFGMLRGVRITSFAISGINFNASELPLRWNQLTVLSISGPPWTIGSAMSSGTILKCSL
jgi:hypothetical protein